MESGSNNIAPSSQRGSVLTDGEWTLTGKIDGALFALSLFDSEAFKLDDVALGLEFKDDTGAVVYAAAIERKRMEIDA